MKLGVLSTKRQLQPQYEQKKGCMRRLRPRVATLSKAISLQQRLNVWNRNFKLCLELASGTQAV